jgi:hypothetical protein
VKQVIKKHVQIIRNDLIIRHAEKRYPHLYSEVYAYDKISSSSWYSLTQEAYEEYKKFRRTVWYRRQNETGN